MDRMDTSKNASKYQHPFPDGKQNGNLESQLADTRREAKVAETEMSTEMKLKIASIPGAVKETVINAASTTAAAASSAATTVKETVKSAASTTAAAAGNATQWLGEKKEELVEKVSNALPSAPSNSTATGPYDINNRNMDLPMGVTPDVGQQQTWGTWIADKASAASTTIAGTASAAGGVLAHQAEAVGETFERAAEKAAKTTHDTFASVTGANKRLVVSYLTGLSNGRWEGSTDAIHEDFVFQEKEGFQGGKDFILRELNRKDRDSNGSFDVWDGGNSFAFRLKTTLQYPRSAEQDISNKRVDATAFGVITLQDGRILQHEQRSDHFRPMGGMSPLQSSSLAAEPNPPISGKY